MLPALSGRVEIVIVISDNIAEEIPSRKLDPLLSWCFNFDSPTQQSSVWQLNICRFYSGFSRNIFPKNPTFSGTDDYEASYSDYEADGSLQAYNNSRGPGHTWGRGEDTVEGDNNNKGHHQWEEETLET